MELAQFQELMDIIKESKTDFQGQIADLKREVQSVQKKTLSNIAYKLGKSGYKFKCKGNEIQFKFNSGIKESMSSAQQELKKIQTVGEEQKEMVYR